MSFKIGDRVRVTKDDDRAKKGMEGRVAAVNGGGVGVDFGPGFKGHDLRGAIQTETGLWVLPDRLELLPPETATSEPRPIKPGSKWRNVHGEVEVLSVMDRANPPLVCINGVSGALAVSHFRATHVWVSDPEPVEKPKVGDWLRSTDTGNYFILTPDRVNGTELFRSCCVDSPFRGSEPCEPPPLVKALDKLELAVTGFVGSDYEAEALVSEWRAIKAKMGVK